MAADPGRRASVRIDAATLDYHDRRVWSELSLEFDEPSFVAILGPNGSGKTSLLRVILGLTPLAAGTVEVLGQAPRRGNPGIGYVPQHQSFDQDLPLRGRDLVQMGIDGHRWGVGRPSA
ncbi:MAG: ATP-binding cassette domain-containing protein, partial [Candidatus Limnocylindrales bacterium]